MKAILGSVLLLAAFGASAATAERVQFTGFVLQDTSPALEFDLHAPARQSTGLLLGDGSTLTIATPGAVAGVAGVQIQLVSPTGEVMHTSTVPDATVASMSFAYRVCRGEAVFMSPAPVERMTCSETP